MRALVDWFGVAIAFLGLIVGGWAIFSSGSVPLTILAVFVCLMAAGAFALAFLQFRHIARLEAKGSRESRWAAGTPKLSNAMGELAMSVGTSEANADDRKVAFQTHGKSAIDAVAAAFSRVTGDDCRVTLKEIYGEPASKDAVGIDHLLVRQLFTSDQRTTVATSSKPDRVTDNTDFQNIINDGDPYFFCNDLPAEIVKGYKNSHWDARRLKQMAQDDSYPYRSTVVWPVRAKVGTAHSEAWNVIGFLCVDSPNTGAFDAKLDTPFGQLIATAFYPVWPRGPLTVEDESLTEKVAPE